MASAGCESALKGSVERGKTVKVILLAVNVISYHSVQLWRRANVLFFYVQAMERSDEVVDPVVSSTKMYRTTDVGSTL